MSTVMSRNRKERVWTLVHMVNILGRITRGGASLRIAAFSQSGAVLMRLTSLRFSRLTLLVTVFPGQSVFDRQSFIPDLQLDRCT